MEAELHQGKGEENLNWVVKTEKSSAWGIWVRPAEAVAIVWHESPNTHELREVSHTSTENANQKQGEPLAGNAPILMQFRGQCFLCSQNACFLCRSPSEHSIFLP